MSQEENEEKKAPKDNTFSLLFRSDKGITKSLGQEKEVQPEEVVTDEETGQKSKERSLLHKMFGPMEAGSVRGSIFAISSLALGTGCLSLPIRFTQMGMAWGLVFLTIAGGIAYWTLTLMIKAAQKSKEKDYSRLVKDCLGKGPAVFLDCVILLYIFGVLISYQVIIYSLIGRVYFYFSGKEGTFETFEANTWLTPVFKFPIMLGMCVILIPMCLLKDISKMRFTSLFSIASLIYVIIVIIAQSPSYYSNFLEKKKSDPSINANFYDLTKAFGYNLIFFPCLATLFFSFTCHAGAFPVYKTLQNPVSRRMNKVFRRSILLDLFIYYCVGICGFLTAPVNAPPLIIYREPLGNSDILMTIGKIGMCLNLMLSTPANYNAFRISFFEVVWGEDTIGDLKNYLVTIPVLLITTIIGALYSDIIAYITLLGGFCSVIITFLFPGLLYVKNNGLGLTHWKNLLILAAVTILCSIGFIAGINTIIM